jgi:HlyD family secretion protein
MPKKLRIIIVLALIGGGVFYWRHTQAQRAANGDVRLTGNIEATEVDVSFKIAGRIAARLVNEGDIVTAGQEVAQLDCAELEQQLAARNADVAAAEAFLRELEAGARPQEIAQAEAAAEQARARLAEVLAGARTREISAAAADVEQARADATRLSADRDRIVRLFGDHAVSAQQHDSTQAAYRVASERLAAGEQRLALLREGARSEQVDQARAAVRQTEERLSLVKAGAREETLEQTRAKVEQARAGQKLAEVQLDNAKVASPVAGFVISENLEAGEFAAPGSPVVTVADLANIWVRVYVPETEMGRIALGQPATVRCDSFPGKAFKGRVDFISKESEFTPKSVQTPEERVKLVYRVKVAVENPDFAMKPGMPVDVNMEAAR